MSEDDKKSHQHQLYVQRRHPFFQTKQETDVLHLCG